MTIHAILGVFAGILSFVACPVYVLDILRGNTKPSKVTWWILSLLNAAIAITYYASGARDTIWIPISYTICFLSIALLSIKYGEGGRTGTDVLCFLGACISLLFWFLSENPTATLVLLVCTDFLGLLPTIIKSYKEPETESKSSWFIATVASLLNIFAIEKWTFSISLYPLYVFITNALILGFIFIRKLDSQGTLQD